MNAKIIQLVALPSEGHFPKLIALTENGKVFERELQYDFEHEDVWEEIPTKEFVHRTGNLI